MWVTKRMNLMSSFDGLVEHFALTNTLTQLQEDYVIDFRNVTDFLYNVRFVNESIMEDGKILNVGS